jgi:hypothetical protein
MLLRQRIGPRACETSSNFSSIVGIVLLSLCFGFSAMAQDASFSSSPESNLEHPPLVPTSEEVASTSDAFAQRCLAYASRMIKAKKLKLGVQLATRSEKWGAIWRADFKFPEGGSSLVNRMMCWERGEQFHFMTSVAQDVPPLADGAGKKL